MCRFGAKSKRTWTPVNVCFKLHFNNDQNCTVAKMREREGEGERRRVRRISKLNHRCVSRQTEVKIKIHVGGQIHIDFVN